MKSAMRWIHLSDLHIDPPSDGRSTEELRADFILDIAEAAEIKITNIYLIPGNHDLNRTKEKESRISGKAMIC